MRTLMKTLLTSIAIGGLFVIATQAATVVPVIAYGHNNRNNFGGNILDIYNGSGMNGFDWTGGSPNDGNPPPGWPTGYGEVTTWTQTSGQYRDEWQADQLLDNTTSINGKVGWVILDLGSSYALDDMYLWNGRQLGTNALDEFNLYYSNGSPVIPGTQGPTGGTDADDYDFGVAAWTQVNNSGLLTLADNNNATPQGIYEMSGITARYVAIEMMSRHNGNTDPNSGRIGFAEVGFTLIPEPSSLAFLGLSGLLFIRRRR